MASKIRWQRFPKSGPTSLLGQRIVQIFEANHAQFSSETHNLNSDGVLGIIGSKLRELGFQVETGKSKDGKIPVPVLYGQNGQIEKAFFADSFHPQEKYMLEVEAGRGVVNYQFLKDLFQACASESVDNLAIAVRNKYKGSDDFGKVCMFIETLFVGRRLVLPLKEILIIGY
mgnify:FL=1